MDNKNSETVSININENDELIIDFNFIDVCIDTPDIEIPQLIDEFK